MGAVGRLERGVLFSRTARGHDEEMAGGRQGITPSQTCDEAKGLAQADGPALVHHFFLFSSLFAALVTGHFAHHLDGHAMML